MNNIDFSSKAGYLLYDIPVPNVSQSSRLEHYRLRNHLDKCSHELSLLVESIYENQQHRGNKTREKRINDDPGHML